MQARVETNRRWVVVVHTVEEVSEQSVVRHLALMDVLSHSMRVPERLGVSPRQHWQREEDGDNVPSLFTMQVPDRLTYTAPDMSPSPMFNQARTMICGTMSLDPCWEGGSGEMFCIEALPSPMRRSFSDQNFSRTPPDAPSPLKQALLVPRAPSNPSGSGLVLVRPQTSSRPQTQTPPAPAPPLSSLSFHHVVTAAKQLGRRASERLLQMMAQKYRFGHKEKPFHPGRTRPKVPASADLENNEVMDTWSPVEDGGGAAVEFIILRRQVMKMNRRLAALEKNNTERRSTEVILFSVIVSACLLNTWLWVRR
ncbi:mitochondrial fission factor-like isoform X3 [Cynoglossus semilaevis]|uniref:mitochondrial fission factor-like isoform X3 n=1 Tax=Cynoglossus semilaevis TaxID=244447 RepID=UPI000D630F8A|nr:mitochondrial fission factor-like isoform X3 [Cynoglossus semilaevis]